MYLTTPTAKKWPRPAFCRYPERGFKSHFSWLSSLGSDGLNNKTTKKKKIYMRCKSICSKVMMKTTHRFSGSQLKGSAFTSSLLITELLGRVPDIPATHTHRLVYRTKHCSVHQLSLISLCSYLGTESWHSECFLDFLSEQEVMQSCPLISCL